jgi:predicted peptidase
MNRNKVLTRWGVVRVLVFSAIAANAQTRPTTSQSTELFAPKITLKYLLYLPPEYQVDPGNAKNGDGRGWPLVLFLHGSGGRGDNIEIIKGQGLPMLVAQGKQFPFILVSPQCPADERWDAMVLSRLLTEMEQRYKVDPDRIYVTGLSMGGSGTWELAMREPDRFAAIVPICGRADPGRIRTEAPPRLAVWAFHGEKDPVVPAEQSQRMIDALRKAGDTEAKLTIYPGIGHDAWTRAYDDPELFRWMLRHKRVPTTHQSGR